MGAFVRREGFEQGADASPDGFGCALISLAEQRLELGEDLLDWIKVGAVGRQEQEPGANRTDGAAHGLAFVAAEIVHDHDIARCERRHEELLDPGEEALAIDGAVDDARRIDAIVAQGGNEGQRAPATVRHLGVKTLPAKTAAVGPGHVGFGPRLVDEDEARRIKPALVLSPLRPPPRDPWTILLAGEHGFF